MVDIYNASYNTLVDGHVINASITLYESAWTFAGVQWFWPIVFLITLLMVAIATENQGMVAIYAILGNVALGTMLPVLSHKIFFMILILSLVIWFYSLFISQRIP